MSRSLTKIPIKADLSVFVGKHNIYKDRSRCRNGRSSENLAKMHEPNTPDSRGSSRTSVLPLKSRALRNKDKNDKPPLADWFPCTDYTDWLKAVQYAIRAKAPQAANNTAMSLFITSQMHFFLELHTVYPSSLLTSSIKNVLHGCIWHFCDGSRCKRLLHHHKYVGKYRLFLGEYPCNRLMERFYKKF